jgi:hypothetical protein
MLLPYSKPSEMSARNTCQKQGSGHRISYRKTPMFQAEKTEILAKSSEPAPEVHKNQAQGLNSDFETILRLP